jgi:hypothetical protein
MTPHRERQIALVMDLVILGGIRHDPAGHHCPHPGVAMNVNRKDKELKRLLKAELKRAREKS